MITKDKVLKHLNEPPCHTTFLKLLNSLMCDIEEVIKVLRELEQDGYITLDDKLIGSSVIKLNTVVIYHQRSPGIDCMDGIAGAWVCKKYYKDVDVLGACYNDNLDNIKAGFIILVDFSVHPEKVKEWLSQHRRVQIIDHHKTSFEEFSISNFSHSLVKDYKDRVCLRESLLTGAIDVSANYSGATLAWNTLFQTEAPTILKYIADADNWRWELEDSRVINAGLSTLKGYHKTLDEKFSFFDLLYRLGDDEDKLLTTLSLIGQDVITKNEELISQVASRWQEKEILGYIVPYIELQSPQEDSLRNSICERLYTDPSLSKYPFIACLLSNRQTYSLRSNINGSNFDVATLAKTVGGGGHRNAAGFTLS